MAIADSDSKTMQRARLGMYDFFGLLFTEYQPVLKRTVYAGWKVIRLEKSDFA